ncbi:hybrid sensor histidine kinase/response regulator transcription factor [Mucilaginibacter sp. FT3.2]|uniref:hybrid sensor histidine kinase/response regulator n=1 Tax=Mucilaginibacter sp. FT3.2 TaxID=2723090 RepID=UPI00161FA4C8|nr:hybrid sensor histidine kinase/response regulator transcription factor [Mucilaginibacter sp. FT3.2]MBB6231543.1 signal transduction histidine kinase/ligand-binding sensor domain-containing protein/AraC-like DNA-binding protein [Mucilaginibacter sp. FT3.2]
MKPKVFLLIVLMQFSLRFVSAQNNQFQFSHLDINAGLSHNQVNCIYKDKKGFMWFGTLSGLNKYDGYSFKSFKHIAGDTTTLDDDYIVSITPGPENKLWIETRMGFNTYDPATEKFSRNIKDFMYKIKVYDTYILAIKNDRFGDFWLLQHNKNQGIFKYEPKTNKTINLTHNNADTSSISSNLVTDLSVDSKGNIWIVSNSGVLERLDPKSYKVNYRLKLGQLPSGLSSSYKIFIDKQDDIWAFVPSYSVGVFYISLTNNIFKHIVKATGKINTDVISDVTQDDENRMWIATDHGGINLLNKSDFKTEYLVNREDDNKTIGQNSITCVYKDNTGIIWCGSYKRGISYYHQSIIKFASYTHHLSDKNSLPFSDVNNFAEDKLGNIWIGTNGGGLIYWDRKAGSFKQYLHNAADKNSLTNNVIVKLFIDHEQKLWIGTYYGGLDCFDGKIFKHYKHNDAKANSISEDRVCAITEDSDNNLLVGTLSAGLNILDKNRNVVAAYKFDGDIAKNTIHSNYVSSLIEDRHKNVWIVTAYGVDRLAKNSHRFLHYLHDDKDPGSLINNNTNNILEDKDGLIWISTREGISIFDYKTNKFTNINKLDGLPDNTVIDMQQYSRNNVWVSTPNGLSSIMVDRSSGKLKFHFTNYNETEGLQGREFTENSSYKTREGELLFGGGNGFNLFKPSNILTNKSQPNLVFTDLQIFNQSIQAGDKVNGSVILTKSITDLNDLKLKYNDNVFAIEFAALNYFNPDKIKYQYKMGGFDKGWINADNKVRKATYTNLDPGDYVFKVRAGTNENWNDKEITLNINISPPFWKTTWAYIFYAGLVLGSLLYLRTRGIQKIRTQFSIEKEREAAQRMHELDLMKIKFFTNVSHEFRTPLSLIMAPVDKILKQIAEPEIQRQLMLINRNAKRLLNLVNQLLDFRKMEYQELKLHRMNGDIIVFIKDLSFAFTDVADQKNIRFVFDSEIEMYYTSFDHDKIERIMFNLLSNAYKFTHEGGQVSVLINLKGNADVDKALLEIRVIDTGIGMAADKLNRIFDPFFQNDLPGSMLNQGSGIGLSIAREFVKLHNGDLLVESEFNQGSCFTVLLPVGKIDNNIFVDTQLHLEHTNEVLHESGQHKGELHKDGRDGKKLTILLVEDNEDFRFYIKDNLKTSFNVIEAENGKKGWQKALSQHPNLIVSDISMPEMNGIDLCLKLKSDKRTSHIPVILLTALTGEDQQLKGLETGATDYLTKPFNFEILQSKIRNILSQQESMRKTYTKQVEVSPTEMHVDSPDEQFIKKVLILIDNNISNPNFSVEELSTEVFVSRYTLYKKILAMTGKTPNELVRSMRLKRAAQLLETGHLTISQICHKVGFKSQKYFVKMFKAEYNTIPSKYIEAAEELDS